MSELNTTGPHPTESYLDIFPLKVTESDVLGAIISPMETFAETEFIPSLDKKNTWDEVGEKSNWAAAIGGHVRFGEGSIQFQLIFEPENFALQCLRHIKSLGKSERHFNVVRTYGPLRKPI